MWKTLYVLSEITCLSVEKFCYLNEEDCLFAGEAWVRMMEHGVLHISHAQSILIGETWCAYFSNCFSQLTICNGDHAHFFFPYPMEYSILELVHTRFSKHCCRGIKTFLSSHYSFRGNMVERTRISLPFFPCLYSTWKFNRSRFTV